MSSKEAPRPGLLRAARDGKITNREGAEALGLSVRQFRRLRRRFERGGAAGLLHAGRGRPSPKQLPRAVRGRAMRLMQGRYAGFNDCHLAEVLREQEQLPLSRSSVRRLRLELGLEPKRRRRPPRHRRRRVREAQAGALLLVDASEHLWCENRGERFALVGALDDATGAIVGLVARPHEDLHGYSLLLQHVFQTRGLPLALYGDRTNIFVRNDRHWTLEEELAGERSPTQLGQVLKRLGIGYIPAQSPQAKGRIERFWGTLQDRLVSVLRLRRASSLEDAARYLPEFIDEFNQRFAHDPRDPIPAWRKAASGFETHFACQYTRTVANDNTVAVGERWIQIPPGPFRRSYAGCRVHITEQLDGTLLVRYGKELIARQAAPDGSFTLRSHRGEHLLRPRRSRALTPPIVPSPPKRSDPPRPGRKHPWRRFNYSNPARVAD